jgi:hypothetical protein
MNHQLLWSITPLIPLAGTQSILVNLRSKRFSAHLHYLGFHVTSIHVHQGRTSNLHVHALTCYLLWTGPTRGFTSTIRPWSQTATPTENIHMATSSEWLPGSYQSKHGRRATRRIWPGINPSRPCITSNMSSPPAPLSDI